MKTEAIETQPSLPPGEASPVPPLLYWSIWISVFTVMVYGLNILFGAGRRSHIPQLPHPAETDALEDESIRE